MGRRSVKESAIRVGQKAHFAWSDVSFTLSPKVIGGSGKDPRVLKNLSGSANPGEVIAIMGASGSGKTSLLNVLSGRIMSMNGHVVTSKFTVNGHEISAEEIGPNVAYVTQEDALCPTATPREALEFSARLRLPPEVTKEERETMIEDVISILHLDKCADTVIGNELIKGISGGEKRRTSIGPTSGLDSYAAYNVVNALKDLAALGCTVLCTIHQPSSEVFHLFDRVLLLCDGRTFYDGSVHDMGSYLASIERPIPPETNPADHVMFLMQTEEKEKLGERDVHSLASNTEDVASLKKIQRQQAGWLTQFIVLGKREVQSVLRDKGTLGRGTIGNGTDIASHFGALANLAISGMFGASQPVILLFPSERPRFVREYATGTYSAVPYFWSKLCTEIPLTFSTSIITFLIAYWIEAFHGSFILHVIAHWLIGVAASSTALFAGCWASNVQVAMQAAPAIFVPQILFAGFFIKIQQIPVWIRWAQYLCSLKFGINLFLLNEFQNGCRDFQRPACAQLLESNDIKPDLWWAYGLILVGIFFFFRFAALIVLTKKARGFALA
ncbi:hypothetical protein GUITHDRAFT_158946 [Guillardia theta CCMP2712]|uniref:ABC transporter domain-containing protein n=1 Tax=Guillardia theta (strain CCMP2712) TaxID=905079 RepID=L1IA02_GUITC|nr:hypothetical protein GUITHDRAFT_158946 [Guillardia theta CCMP2712]EKX32917.1 hypothetical protein GUITHDRAFT_158946 [Guillardia theta CCMP2712]|eukprot:XP_005819897.1 hypothetical protein GUITHDRAFT_158946 [Guillardia theta CCMP2712]